jgi:4-hydroxybenzoate polyprenyltransferase
MQTHDRPPLWKQIIRQSFLGKRGFSKTILLWLPIAVILTIRQNINIENVWKICLWLFVAGFCRTQVLILTNDVADRDDDRAAGKTHWITLLPMPVGAVIIICLLAMGTALFIFAHAWIALAVYLTALFIGMYYSLHPIRFKNRGLWGLITYSFYSALAYVVVPWALFRAGWQEAMTLSCAVFLDRWVNLHFHQIVDFNADTISSSHTYVVRVGVERARRELAWMACAASVSFTGVLAFLAVNFFPTALPEIAITIALAAAAGLYAWRSRRSERASSLVRELPFHYLGLTFALFRCLPILLLIRLSAHNPWMWIPTSIAALSIALESGLSFKYKYP